MGFYRETPGPVQIRSSVYADGVQVYVHIPSHLRNRLEVVVGHRMEGRIDRIESAGGMTRSIDAAVSLQVMGYWHELHLPDDVVQQFGIRPGDQAWITIHRIVRHGVAMDV